MKRLLVGVAALVLVVAGCGSADQEPNLARAVERTEASGSSRIELRALVSENGSQTELRCDGSADYTRKRLRIECNDQAFGEMIVVGNRMYLKGGAFLGHGMRWVKLPLTEDDSIHNFAPDRLLTLLRDASLETERIGEEDVRGEPAVRYRLMVNCEHAELNCPGTTTPVDVWIDHEGLVRKLALEDDGDPGTIEFFDFGITVDIEPPPAEEVVAEDHLLVPGESSIGTSKEFVCAEGNATPISQARAVEALRRQGFSVRNDPQACMFSNTEGDAADVLKREGIVHCSVHAESPPDAPRTVTRRGVDGADAELTIENLECTIFTDSPTGEEKIDKLEAAFEELERAIRP